MVDSDVHSDLALLSLPLGYKHRSWEDDNMIYTGIASTLLMEKTAHACKERKIKYCSLFSPGDALALSCT